mgnify:CR=1 FL=1
MRGGELVDGLFEEKSGTIDLPISRKQGSIIERAINKKRTLKGFFF